MGEGAHAMLWRIHAGLCGLADEAWPEAARSGGAACGRPLRWHDDLSGPPERGAVRAAHELAMGPAGLACWRAAWPGGGAAPAALRCALAAAPLLAGRPDLSLLVAPAAAGMEGEAAIVDGETCARLAVAGHDAEIELRLGNCAAPLAECGALADVAPLLAGAPPARRYLLIGLRTDAPAGH